MWTPEGGGPPMRLVQQGNSVTGTYHGGAGHEGMTGTINGTFDGKTFDGTFENHEGGVSGRGTVTLALDGGRLEGVWASTSTPGQSGEWILRKQSDEATNPPGSASPSAGDVDEKPRILERPSPQYTEVARRNQISGSVTLRVTLLASGQVGDIEVVSGLPDGLTERAISAARRIKFIPAKKGGQPVTHIVKIEYNFSLY